jgi:hypothetical protein
LNQIHVLFLTNKQKQQNCDYATKTKNENLMLQR